MCVLAGIFLFNQLCLAQAMQENTLYHEQYRPQFHFSAQLGWINDPNGLVYFDGEYHLFYQGRTDSLEQTPVMSWGHAVSPDLVHWKQLPVALHPDDHDGWIWSGSAVVDWKNTSGFGTPGHPPLVAMYTAAKDPFAQAIAYSNDRGRTFTKYAGNPVLAHIAGSNRDPHVIWHEPTRQWIVVLYKDVDNTFCIFSSPNLKEWTHLQDFEMPGCIECPDFFPIALDGNASQIKWVFTAANGHYLVGDFDGRHFAPTQEVRQVDFGRNFYAVQSYSDIPASDGRRIQIAWMRGGNYPGMPFNQQMSFPAELTLRTTSDGPRLFRNPVHEINLLHISQRKWADTPISPATSLRADIPGDTMEIRADIEISNADSVALSILGQTISYDAKTKILSALGDAPLTLTDGHLRLTILVDRTSIETFANDGRVSLTSCYLPDASENALSITARGGAARLRVLEIYGLKSIWPASASR
jgi:sucrose-6-phosphate hydrolase SacC (GH32 family)